MAIYIDIDADLQMAIDESFEVEQVAAPELAPIELIPLPDLDTFDTLNRDIIIPMGNPTDQFQMLGKDKSCGICFCRDDAVEMPLQQTTCCNFSVCSSCVRHWSVHPNVRARDETETNLYSCPNQVICTRLLGEYRKNQMFKVVEGNTIVISNVVGNKCTEHKKPITRTTGKR